MPSQMHGKTFENAVKSANGIVTYAVADRKRGPSDPFDIDGKDGTEKNIPTSIKSTQSDSIPLSSAPRVWRSLDYAPYRMLVGLYRQEDDRKAFESIHEFTLRKSHRKALLGSVSRQEIDDYDAKLKGFPRGHHDRVLRAGAEGRAWPCEGGGGVEAEDGVVRKPKGTGTEPRRRPLSCRRRGMRGWRLTGTRSPKQNAGMDWRAWSPAFGTCRRRMQEVANNSKQCYTTPAKSWDGLAAAGRELPSNLTAAC